MDDDPFVLRGLRRLLSSAGFDVATYASGAEFLDHEANAAPDCVVLDLNMPHMSGFDVQARLAEAGRTTPVIVITGDVTADAHSRALRLGAAAYLEKPVDQSTLLAAIGDAIGGGSRRPDIMGETR